MPDTSSKISLIVGLSLPVVMVAIIAGLVFLPSRSLTPANDFIYVVGPYPSYTSKEGKTITQHDISIKNGQAIHTTTSYSGGKEYDVSPRDKIIIPRFFIHHTRTNTNNEISLEEVIKLRLSPERKSPDGFTLTFGKQSYGIFPFFFENRTDMEHAYLSTDRASKEITLVSEVSIDYYQIQLVGWVITET